MIPFRVLACAWMLAAGMTAAHAAAPAIPPLVTDGGDRPWVLCFEDRDIPPRRLRDGSGLNRVLLEAAAARAGIALRVVALPWRRCQSDVASGELDGLFAISHSAEREPLWVYPPADPERAHFRMFRDGYVLIRRRGEAVDAVDGEVVGLRGRIGAQPGYSVVVDLQQRGLDVDEGTPEPALIVRKLAEGRLGAAALGMSAWRDLQAHGEPALSQVEATPEPLVVKDYYLVVSTRRFARSPDTTRALWAAIAELRETLSHGAPIPAPNRPIAPVPDPSP